MNPLLKLIRIFSVKKDIILITTGDQDGIGLEITIKALSILKSHIQKNKIKVVVFLSADSKKNSSLKESNFITFFDSQANSHLDLQKDLLNLVFNTSVIFLFSKCSPTDWVFASAKIALKYPSSFALVTGPLSKIQIHADGYPFIGHTEILKKISKRAFLFMGFKGRHFNVVLATGHIPLKKVSDSLTSINWKLLVKLISIYFGKKQKIGFVGLNPHNGENGIISNSEEVYLTSIQKKFKQHLSELIVPDAAFLKTQWTKYSVFLCLYHDQGLIPFKAIHGQDSGVHITLGLPFIRTSVDHGTAKDIFGKNIANPNSMKEAIVEAFRLLKSC